MTATPKVAFLPKTELSRLLVDLTSYANDLSEAAHSIGPALELGEESELWEPLTAHAVTAYIRPFMCSHVRERLDEIPAFPGIPSHLQGIHDVVRKYRNTTIAHSQSDLVLVMPMVMLTDEGTVSSIVGVTIAHAMPRGFAERFEELIGTMESRVADTIQLVVAALQEEFGGATAEEISAWPEPEMVDGRDMDFDASGKRRTPPQFTRYWHTDTGPGATDGSE